jgi:hypothetical protein
MCYQACFSCGRKIFAEVNGFQCMGCGKYDDECKFVYKFNAKFQDNSDTVNLAFIGEAG